LFTIASGIVSFYSKFHQQFRLVYYKDYLFYIFTCNLSCLLSILQEANRQPHPAFLTHQLTKRPSRMNPCPGKTQWVWPAGLSHHNTCQKKNPICILYILIYEFSYWILMFKEEKKSQSMHLKSKISSIILHVTWVINMVHSKKKGKKSINVSQNYFRLHSHVIHPELSKQE